MVFPQPFETKWILFPFSLGLIIFFASKAQWHDRPESNTVIAQLLPYMTPSPFQAPIPHIPLFASVLPLAVWDCQFRLQCWEERERERVLKWRVVTFSFTFSGEEMLFQILSATSARPSGNQHAECFLKLKNRKAIRYTLGYIGPWGIFTYKDVQAIFRDL